MIITFKVITCIDCTSTNTWSNANHGLSAKIRDYKSDENTAEINPINEGFILISNEQKKPPRSTISPTRTSSSRTLHNVSSTTCKTKHQTISTFDDRVKTISLENKRNYTVCSIVKKLPSRRGRRLLNEPNYDTDTSSANMSVEDNSDMESFLKVDGAELSKQLINMALVSDGSGESKY